MKPMFVVRDPWAALIVALVLGPFAGMLYLGRGRLALGYLLLECLVLLARYSLLYSAVSETAIGWTTSAVMLIIRAIGTGHSFLLAKRLGEHRPEAWFARWYWLIGLAYVIPFAVFMFVRTAFWEPFHMPAASMMPSLMPGDIVVASKYTYGYSRHSFPIDVPMISGRVFHSDPELGDIVVYASPTQPGVDRIGRVVGVPGDRIRVLQGVLHIDGEPVERRSVGRYEDMSDGRFPRVYNQYIERLPNGREYAILEQSDYEATDNTEEVLVPRGHYFVLGDHRDQSLDSRHMGALGFIPSENLIGRISLVLWNSDDRRIRYPE